MSLGLNLDTSEFDKNINRLIRKTPGIANKSLVELADQVRTDANTIPPKTPHLWDQLRSEIAILIVKDYVVVIWFQMPYAAKWHEADPDEVTFSEAADGVGVKYLETKLFRFKDDYAKYLAELMRKRIANA